ncbi:unnamed protein product, partial [marine sediment metagenome]
QLFTLKEIVRTYQYLLDMGYAFMVFNFRGYRYSEGKISLEAYVSDTLQVIEFVEKMAGHNIFDLNNVNILGHDLGGYIALILCSQVKIINKLVLLSPIIDLKRHIESEDFPKVLHYINRFLPGNVRFPTNDINEFIRMTKNELSMENFQIERIIQKLQTKKLKVILGEVDKVTPTTELHNIIQKANIIPEIAIISCMDHECAEDEEIERVTKEIVDFFKI